MVVAWVAAAAVCCSCWAVAVAAEATRAMTLVCAPGDDYDVCQQSVDVFNVAVASHRVGDLDTARGLYVQSVALYPRMFHAHLNIAEIDTLQGRTGSALEHLKRCIETADDAHTLAAALNNYGLAFMESNKHDLGSQAIAMDFYRRSLELDPDSYSTAYNMALALEAQGKWVEARDMFDRVLQRRPGDGAALLGMGNVMFFLGRETDAVGYYAYVSR
jgi:tetratricopeptide (TPR) repeat protein